MKFNHLSSLLKKISEEGDLRQFSRHRGRRLLSRVQLLQDVPGDGDGGPVGRGRGGVEGGVVAALDADDDLAAVAVAPLIDVGDAVDDGLGARGADDALVEAIVHVHLAMIEIIR